MGLDEDAGGEAEQGVVVGEDADDVGAPLDLFVESFSGIRAPDLAPMRFGGRRRTR
jgi:hypothetical protein